MKKILIPILFAALTLGSCNKFLDTKPTDFYNAENFYNSEADLRTALNGIYGTMTHSSLYGQVLIFNFTSTNDEILTSRTADGDTRGLGYNFDASNVYIDRMYSACYVGINNANLLLQNINKPQMKESNRNRIKGEALFLRSYFYFILVTNFGKVPLMLEPVPISQVNMPAAELVDIYGQIEKDLKEAEGLLEGVTAAKLGYNDAVNISAVQAMLARVYINWAGFPVQDKSKFQDVITYADKVIDSKLHRLNPDYAQLFINLAVDKYDLEENILEWGFAGAAAGENNKGNDIGNFVGVLSNYLATDPTSYTSAGWVYITRKLYDSYEDADLRKAWNCANYGWSGNPRKKNTYTNPWQMYVGKFKREYVPQSFRMNGTYNINWPAIRYAEVLLMKAEAENEVHSGPTEAAYNAINQIRKRGYGITYGNILKTITVTNGGSGYSSSNPPAVTISGAGGAEATAVVNAAGAVTGITIVKKGTLTASGPYYTQAPTITITPPNSGTTATAVATITASTDANAPSGLDKKAFFELVKNERMRELVGEGFRKADLIRWGNFLNDIRDFYAYAVANGGSTGNANGVSRLLNISEKHVLLPIPIFELNLNKAMNQNQGW